MKLVALDVQFIHLCVCYFDACLIVGVVERRLNIQAGCRGRSRDEIDNRRQTIERTAAPVLTNERKEPMLDFVPLTRPRWEMTDRNLQPQAIRQLLKLDFP